MTSMISRVGRTVRVTGANPIVEKDPLIFGASAHRAEFRLDGERVERLDDVHVKQPKLSLLPPVFDLGWRVCVSEAVRDVLRRCCGSDCVELPFRFVDPDGEARAYFHLSVPHVEAPVGAVEHLPGGTAVYRAHLDPAFRPVHTIFRDVQLPDAIFVDDAVAAALRTVKGVVLRSGDDFAQHPPV